MSKEVVGVLREGEEEREGGRGGGRLEKYIVQGERLKAKYGRENNTSSWKRKGIGRG